MCKIHEKDSFRTITTTTAFSHYYDLKKTVRLSGCFFGIPHVAILFVNIITKENVIQIIRKEKQVLCVQPFLDDTEKNYLVLIFAVVLEGVVLFIL